ncbi:MAG: thioesterase family protein [Chloroflexi bacterium]|nr:thioesterase family protein [Chloroflexota bacterium]
MALTPGMSKEVEMPTKAGMGVTHVGPVEMLSTPSMIGMMEGTALKLLQEHTDGGMPSVGARIDVRHLAPSPVGKPVKIKATYIGQDGRQHLFRVQAYFGETLIGDGTHWRAVVDPARFAKK